MSHALCCIHPQQRIDSPEPPARPPTTIDGIFAAAALPEDHPHAIKFPQKKLIFEASIARSPNIADRIKLQFRHRSINVLRSDEKYDFDAKAMTSTEVVGTVGHDEGSEMKGGDAEVLLPRVPTPLLVPGSPRSTDVRASVMKNFEWLGPMLQQ